MVLRRYTTKTVTMTGATATSTIEAVRGHIKYIAIKPSGTSTNFRISCNKAGITEYIVGNSGALSVLAVGTIIYPKVAAQSINNINLATTGDIYKEITLLDEDVTIAVTNGADTETFIVDIITEE